MLTSTLTPPALATSDHGQELGRLLAETRRLWEEEPAVPTDGREAVVRELIDIDLVLERLLLRTRWGSFDADDAAELQRCAGRLHFIQGLWSSPDPAATNDPAVPPPPAGSTGPATGPTSP